MKRLATMLILAASATGCAAAPAPPPAAAADEVVLGYFTPHRGTVAGSTFKVTTDGISSADVQIGRTPDGFRGMVRRQPIEMRVEGNDIVGDLGGLPIRLAIEPEGERVLVHGLWGGSVVSFALNKGAPPPRTAWQPSLSVEPPHADAPPAEVRAVAQRAAPKVDEREAIALLAVMLLTSSGRSLGPAALPVQVGRPPGVPGIGSSPPPTPQRFPRAHG